MAPWEDKNRLFLLQLIAQLGRPLTQGIVSLSGLRLTLGRWAVESNGGLCSRLKRMTRNVSCIPKWATIERLRLGWGQRMLFNQDWRKA